MGLLASLLAFVGCDQLVKSQVVYSTGADIGSMLQASAADGPLLVESMGETLGQSAESLNARMIRLLNDNNPRPWLKFESERSRTSNEFKLVFVFDARTVRQPDFPGICAGRAPRFEKNAGQLNVHAVFCTPNGPAVAVWGWVKRPQGVDDPAFDRLMIQVGHSVLRGAT